jgi:hypothetical protein
MAAKRQPAKLGDARDKLVAERQKLVARLASKYSVKAVQDFVWVSDAIELIDEMIRAEGRTFVPPERPSLSPRTAEQMRGRRGPHEEGEE